MYKNEKKYCKILIEELNRRKERNSSYSLRSFAKALGIHSSSLSAVLNGKRNLPLKRADEILEKLRLTDVDSKAFMESLKKAHLSIHRIKLAENGNFDIPVKVSEKLDLSDINFADIPEELKSLTSMIVEADREKVVGVKKIINEFYKKLYMYVNTSEEIEVDTKREKFNFSIQFFPTDSDHQIDEKMA